MAQLYASLAIGTACTLMATILFLLRAETYGRRPVLALARRWIAMTRRTSGVVLILLSATAFFCFALIADHESGHSGRSLVLSGLVSQSVQTESPDLGDADAGDAIEALRGYADQFDGKSIATENSSPKANAAALPDVDTMIAKLITRLEEHPNDVNGWKMLGWSYLNTGRSQDAAKAYETALKLEPDNIEIKKGLDAAKSAQTVPAPASQSNSPSGPIDGDDMKSAHDLSDNQRNVMIHDMVDRLAARLKSSPNDENGWLRLMSSRATLGERDAAKIALRRALAAFANDAAARTRLIAAARELGMEPD